MSAYEQFIFDSYRFDPGEKQLQLHYTLDDRLKFTETYRFDFDFAAYDDKLLDRALQTLFFMAGVSYYKTFLPPQIVIRSGQLDSAGADFFAKTYRHGLGEFFYVNQLDPNWPINFEPTTGELPPVDSEPKHGLLISIGGGKDSLVSVELLKGEEGQRLGTFSMGHRSQLELLVSEIGLPHYWVERTWDRQLLDLNQQGAYNGHVPFSAILAAAGTVTAVLAGYRDVVVSNESSASEPSLVYNGQAINHQYSKSLEFERDYQAHLQRSVGDAQRYYSLLRPLSELRIAELFAGEIFDKYRPYFSSCNRAYTHDADHIFWCGECPKCAFVFLALTPFVPRQKLEQLWGGKNLLLDPALEPVYRSLLGIEGDKPLDCVGEVKECRAAMRLAQQTYPELQQSYQFDLPDNYDFRAESEHAIPADIVALFENRD